MTTTEQKIIIPDQVFLDPAAKAAGEHDHWRAVLNGKVLPHTWNSKGAALAGIVTERKREERRARQIASKSEELLQWERDMRKAHPNVCFYIEVRGSAQVSIAYDSKTGERYGEWP